MRKLSTLKRLLKAVSNYLKNKLVSLYLFVLVALSDFCSNPNRISLYVKKFLENPNRFISKSIQLYLGESCNFLKSAVGLCLV